MSTTALRFDMDAIRRANPVSKLLQSRGIELRGSDAKGWRVACPIHKGDNKQAFHILPGDHSWHCFTGGCGGGSVIDLLMGLDGVDFKTACERLGGAVEAASSTTPLPAKPKAPKRPPAPLPELDDAKRAEMQAIADRMANDTALIESLAVSRNWEPATVSALACTGALGWIDADAYGRPAVAFIFPHAVKIRTVWRDGTGWKWHRWCTKKQKWDKVVSWHWDGWPWNAAELWREDRIRLLLHDRVVITEGEPDSITLIDAGANDYRTTVCAIPSATVSPRLKARLPDLVRGLHVRLAADTDDAGRQSATEMQRILAPVSTTFSTLKF